MKKIIGFGATWCHFCKELQPTLMQLAEEGLVNLEPHDIDQEPELAKQMNVKNIPMLFFYDEEGNNHQITTGVLSREEILEIYNLQLPVVEEE